MGRAGEGWKPKINTLSSPLPQGERNEEKNIMKQYVISLGGSLVNPGKINVPYLRDLRKLLLGEVKKGARFFLVVGGGQPARQYQDAGRRITNLNGEDLDWVGIGATKQNAELVRVIFGKLAYGAVLSDPSNKINTPAKINVFSGWKPGRSTDFDAVKVAEVHKIKTVINLSNVDYVYDSDPRKNKRAKKLPRLSWAEFQKMFSPRWNPGAHVPFDPTGARLAAKRGIRVIVANGAKLKNLAAVFSGRRFKGTVIG